MLIIFLFLAVCIAYFSCALWTVHIAEYEGTFYIRRLTPMIGWEYLEIPQKNRYTEGGYTAPYWWTGRSYMSVSKFKTTEEAEEGFNFYKEYRKPTVKMIKRLK